LLGGALDALAGSSAGGVDCAGGRARGSTRGAAENIGRDNRRRDEREACGTGKQDLSELRH